MKKGIIYITLAAIAGVFLASCGNKKKAVAPTVVEQRTEQKKHVVTIQEKTIAAQPVFSSLYTQKARFTINYAERQISANGSISLLTDSLLVLALQPILGIELYRLEATPTELLVIDKMNKRYVRMSYNDLQTETGLPVRFADIQAIVMNRLFVIGQPQSFFTKKELSTTSQNGQSTLRFHEGKLTYRYVIDEKQLMPITAEATMDGNKGVSTINYKGHTLQSNILYPTVVEFSFRNDKTYGTAEITLSNIAFNRTTINRLKTNNYKPTTLGAIIPGF